MIRFPLQSRALPTELRSDVSRSDMYDNDSFETLSMDITSFSGSTCTLTANKCLSKSLTESHVSWRPRGIWDDTQNYTLQWVVTTFDTSPIRMADWENYCEPLDTKDIIPPSLVGKESLSSHGVWAKSDTVFTMGIRFWTKFLTD